MFTYEKWIFFYSYGMFAEQEILYCVEKYSCVVVIAETGSGKTTSNYQSISIQNILLFFFFSFLTWFLFSFRNPLVLSRSRLRSKWQENRCLSTTTNSRNQCSQSSCIRNGNLHRIRGRIQCQVRREIRWRTYSNQIHDRWHAH